MVNNLNGYPKFVDLFVESEQNKDLAKKNKKRRVNQIWSTVKLHFLSTYLKAIGETLLWGGATRMRIFKIDFMKINIIMQKPASC